MSVLAILAIIFGGITTYGFGAGFTYHFLAVDGKNANDDADVFLGTLLWPVTIPLIAGRRTAKRLSAPKLPEAKLLERR